MLTRGVEKYSQGTMLFGGLTARGLIPPNSPIFMDEIKSQWTDLGNDLGNRGGITSELYLWMISK